MNATRTLGINLLLASLGAVCGAIAVLGAIGGPFLTWSALRRVPLWRAIVEPGAGAVVGGAVAFIIGAPVALLTFMPVGIGFAAWRLHHVYREHA